MCVINITISAPSVAIKTAAEGRYKLQSEPVTWTNFAIANYASASTPDITVIGLYNLEVRVESTLDVFSAWKASTFEVSANCTP